MLSLSRSSLFSPCVTKAWHCSISINHIKPVVDKIFFDLADMLNRESMYAGKEFKEIKIEPSIEALFQAAESLLTTFQSDEALEFKMLYMRNLYVNTETLIQAGFKVNSLFLMHLIANRSIKILMDKTTYPLTISLLTKRAKDLHKTDVNGWTLLHYAAFLKNRIVIQELINRGFAETGLKDNEGLTPLDLACWTMNRKIIQVLSPNNDPKELLSALNPIFFSATIDKLKNIEKNNPEIFDARYSTLLGESLPSLELLARSNDRSKAEENYLKLYYPTRISPEDHLHSSYSPMGLAVYMHDLAQVHDLVEDGWNLHIENLYSTRRACFRKVAGLNYALNHLDMDAKDSLRQALECLKGYDSTDPHFHQMITGLIMRSKIQDEEAKAFSKNVRDILQSSHTSGYTE